MAEFRNYGPLNIEQIRKFIPHRHPFLLIDKVIEIHAPASPKGLTVAEDKIGVRVVAHKNVSYGESVFQGHFPDYSILPGVMIVEAMAQTSCFSVLPFLDPGKQNEFQCFLVGVDNARFRRPVVPGDVLRLETVVNKFRGKLWGFTCTATVDGQKAAECEILANLVTKGDVA